MFLLQKGLLHLQKATKLNKVQFMFMSLFMSLAALQVSIASEEHTVTEGNVVDITLHLSSNHEVDFTVTLQSMAGSADGESFHCNN